MEDDEVKKRSNTILANAIHISTKVKMDSEDPIDDITAFLAGVASELAQRVARIELSMETESHGN